MLAFTLVVSFSLPVFVVTNITPLAPRAPQIAVAEASFKIEKLSIVSAGILFRSDAEISTSSSIIRGVARPPNVPIPRMQKAAASPGAPLLVVEITPASLPANELVSEEVGEAKARPFTDVMAPVTETFFCVPAPTTTTSLSNSFSVSNLILKTPRSPTCTSFVLYPTKLI